MSEVSALAQHLRQPEYWHVLLNPLPPLAMGLGAVLLAVSLVPAAEGAAITGLIAVAAGGTVTLPVVLLGQRAYDRLFDGLSSEAKLWLDVHMARAEKAQYLFYITAIVAVIALAQRRRRSSTARPLHAATLLLATASAAAAAWIAHAGGQVNHPEFRSGPPTESARKIVPRGS